MAAETVQFGEYVQQTNETAEELLGKKEKVKAKKWKIMIFPLRIWGLIANQMVMADSVIYTVIGIFEIFKQTGQEKKIEVHLYHCGRHWTLSPQL